MNFTSQIQSSLSLHTQINQDITAKAWGKAEHHNFGTPAGNGGAGVRKANPATAKPLRKPSAVSHSGLCITYKHRAMLEAVWLVLKS